MAQLRKNPLIAYQGNQSWPPVWIATKRPPYKVLRGEIGVLRDILWHASAPNQCLLIMEFGASRYSGALLMDDNRVAYQLHNVLKAHIGKNIQEVGDLEVVLIPETSEKTVHTPPSFPPDGMLLPAAVRRALDRLLDTALTIHRTDLGSIQLVDPEAKALVYANHRGFGAEFLDHFSRVGREANSACARAFRKRVPVFIPDVNSDSLFTPYRDVAKAAGFRAVQSTPIMTRSGEILGVLCTHFRHSLLHATPPPTLQPYVQDAGELIARLRTA